MLVHTVAPGLSRRNVLRTNGALAVAGSAAAVSKTLPGLARKAAGEASEAAPAVGVYSFEIGPLMAYSISDGGGPASRFPVYPVFTRVNALQAEVKAVLEGHFLPRGPARGGAYEWAPAPWVW